MNKSLIAITAFFCSFAVEATLPESLASKTTDTDAIAIYNAMDCFEDACPDGMNKVCYDAFPDGRKSIQRSIRFSINPYVMPHFNRACHVFDSITAIPNPRRIVVKNIEANPAQNSSRGYQYSYNSRPNNDVNLNFAEALREPGSAAAFTYTGNVVILAQNWMFDSDVKVGAADSTALCARFNELNQPLSAYVLDMKYVGNESGGDIRLRETFGDKYPTSGQLIVALDVPTAVWISLHHLFMDHFGADENISLTYSRSERTVTLVDYTTKKIYAASFVPNVPGTASNGRLCYFIGTFTGKYPFLPSSWDKLSFTPK